MIKTIKTPTVMRTPLITEYKTLTVYFIIHVSMSSQLKHYQPKPYALYHKVLCYMHGENPSSTPSITARKSTHKQPSQKIVLKKRDSRLVRKQIIICKIIFKIPTW